MSNQTNDSTFEDEDETGQDAQPAPKKNFRRELEDRAREAEERAAALERKLAFSEVGGLDPSNPQHEYFKSTYTGDPDPAKIREAAIKAGFLVDEQAAAAKESVDQETRFNNASADAPPADLSTTDAEKLKAIQGAKSPKEFWAAAKAAGYVA